MPYSPSSRVEYRCKRAEFSLFSRSAIPELGGVACLSMVRLLIFVAAMAHGITAGASTDACPQLVAGKPLPVVTSRDRPACVAVTVSSGEAAQIVADRPEDLALRVTGGEEQLLVDGFEFGKETLTIDAPGHYRIEILVVGVTPKTTQITVPILRTSLPLPEAARWKSAEMSATESKRSGQLSKILPSLDLWQTISDQSSIARTLLKLGDSVVLSGDLARARDAYEHALEICHSIADLRCAAEAANNSGFVAHQLGDFNSSYARLSEAGQTWQKLSMTVEQGKTLSNLGILYSQIGDFEKSISAYDRARTLLRDRDRLAYARVLNNLGLSYLSLAQYDVARLYFEQAIVAESKLNGAAGDLARAHLNFGRTLMLQGQLYSARTVIEHALAETEKRNDRPSRALAMNNLGQTLFRLGLMDASESRLRHALGLHQALGDKKGQAIALHYLGMIAQKKGDQAAARQLLNEALQIRRDYGLRDDAADSLIELAALEFAGGHPSRAWSLAEEAMSTLELVQGHVPSAALRASFYARRRTLLDLLISIAMRPDNTAAVADGLIAAELGRRHSLLDLIAERRFSASRPQELAERQAKIRRETALLSVRAVADPSDYDKIKSRFQALIAQDEEVEARIRESIEGHEPGAKPLTSVSSLQAKILTPQSTILEYQLGEHVSHLWIIRDRKIEAFALPARAVIERQVSAAVSLFGKVFDRRRDRAKQAAFENAMSRLSSTLLGPIQGKELPMVIILVLDGDLYKVPFAALRLSRGQYLGIGHDLMCAPSAAFLMQASQPTPAAEFPKSVLALSDPVFSPDDPRVPAGVRKFTAKSGQSLPRLPFDEELGTIARLVPSTRRDFLRGFDANAENLQKLPLDRYRILHLSTHSIVNDAIPELSRIALSVIDRNGRAINGFMFPYQLADLHLRGSVVVLSACDTTLSKNTLGEGLSGFAGSLFSAGASQLVLTLSEVDAQASSLFLSEAYSHLLGHKSTTLEHSLTLARSVFLKSERWSDPYYWAAFVAIGMPTPSSWSTPGGFQ